MIGLHRSCMHLALAGALAFAAGCSHTGKLPAAATDAQLTEGTLQVGAATVPYRDSGGSGVPVVLLHAASGKSQMWVHQVPAFTAAGFRVIAIDWRQPNPGSPIGSHSTLLIEAVLAKLGVKQAHFVGSAAGGGAAFQYALTHPAQVRSLLIANSIGFVTDREYLEMGNRLRPAPQFGALPVEFRELGPSYRAANPEGVARWKALAYNFVPAAPTLAVPVAPGAPAAPALVPGSNAVVTFAKLETLKMPTLLLTGDADLYTPPAVLRMFGAHMKHAELVVTPETGHSAFWEQPEIFNRTALAFLRKH
jgi:pimeloyl-ACP methyl ester carboxylesterase